jgi:hypothetical protein
MSGMSVMAGCKKSRHREAAGRMLLFRPLPDGRFAARGHRPTARIAGGGSARDGWKERLRHPGRAVPAAEDR